ncbi:DNA-binding protein [Pseudactinotalea sp. HY160]|nr:Rv2175c family DNA-binding protein [Pseudactinotalea sp. HY160]MPV49435.1 DNA-binding protein [Pseudactinotalea sp. HY160]QGH70969.1 DNA-binding protein [Pseudactinotalea sp. HY158]
MTTPTWTSVPDVAEMLELPLRRVRTLITDRALLAIPVGTEAIRSVPAQFLLPAGHPKGPAPLPALRGTIIVLADAGLTDREIVDWLFAERSELGASPLAALHQGRTTTVRRLAQTVG